MPSSRGSSWPRNRTFSSYVPRVVRWDLYRWSHLGSPMCVFAQLCPTICNPMACSPPGTSVHGIPQARILEWVAISYSRESSKLRGWTFISCIGRQDLYQLSHQGRHTYIYIFIFIYLYIHMTYIYIYTHIHICVYMYTQWDAIYIYIYIHTHTHSGICVHVCVCVYVYIYIYIHIYKILFIHWGTLRLSLRLFPYLGCYI